MRLLWPSLVIYDCDEDPHGLLVLPVVERTRRLEEKMKAAQEMLHYALVEAVVVLAIGLYVAFKLWQVS